MSGAGVTGSVAVVRAGSCDADALSRLHAGLFDAPWDAESFRQTLAPPGAIAFAAHWGAGHAGAGMRSEWTRGAGRNVPGRGCGQLCGFILGRLAADEAEILTLGVARDWQRLGVGGRLVEALCCEAGKRGARHLYLEVAAGNAAARAFYGGLGFQERGRRTGYYARAGARAEDAINLSLPLRALVPPSAVVDD